MSVVQLLEKENKNLKDKKKKTDNLELQNNLSVPPTDNVVFLK